MKADDFYKDITLEHMMEEFDLTDPIVKDEVNGAFVTALYVTRLFFWSTPGIQRVIDNGKLTYALNAARESAAVFFATGQWADLGDRALLTLMQQAEETAWPSVVGYGSIGEMLQSHLDEAQTSTNVSLLTFLSKQLLPFAEQMGIDPILLYGSSKSAKKLRAMVPAARHILDNKELSDQDKSDQIAELLELTANPNVTFGEVKIKSEKVRGIPQREKLMGFRVILPNNETFIGIYCPTLDDERVVEHLISNVVDLRVTDYVVAINELNKFITNNLDDEEEIVDTYEMEVE